MLKNQELLKSLWLPKLYGLTLTSCWSCLSSTTSLTRFNRKTLFQGSRKGCGFKNLIWLLLEKIDVYHNLKWEWIDNRNHYCGMNDVWFIIISSGWSPARGSWSPAWMVTTLWCWTSPGPPPSPPPPPTSPPSPSLSRIMSQTLSCRQRWPGPTQVMFSHGGQNTLSASTSFYT